MRFFLASLKTQKDRLKSKVDIWLGWENLPKEAVMILEYVQEKGRITTREAAALTHMKGVQAIQEQAACLAAYLDDLEHLLNFLQQMTTLFTTSAGCRQNKRRKKPNTWQRLQSLN